MSLRTNPRRGFTLVELLVVITIGAALMALMASAAMKLIEVQQTANTQSTLDRAQSVLTKNWSAVKDAAYKDALPSAGSSPTLYSWIYANFGGNIDPANAAGLVRVVYVKLKMRQAFPMNFTEALYPPSDLNGVLCPFPQLQPLPGYVTYLNSHGISMSSGNSWESSACLLMALQRGVGGTTVAPSSLTSGGAGGVDSSGYNVPVLNDAWGRPIYFSRVPVGCPVLNGQTAMSVATVLASGGACYAQPGANDPLDPQGYLQVPSWGTSAYGSLFQADTQQLLAPTNCSYKVVPMVGSGGPGRDKQPAFDPITFAPYPDTYPMYAN